MVYFNNTLTTRDTVHLQSNLIVDNEVTLKNTLTTNETVYMLSNLEVHKNIFLNGQLSLQDNVYVDGSVLKIPTGLISERPDKLTTPTGSIFFNKTSKLFEGLHDFGNNNKEWVSLGGVRDVDGDTLITTNNNEIEIYAGNSNITRMTIASNQIDVLIDHMNIDSVLTVSKAVMTSNLDVSGKITSHLIPDDNMIYDLGTSNNKWRDLYLSGSTLYVDDFVLSVDTDTQTGRKTLNIKDNQGNAGDINFGQSKNKGNNETSENLSVAKNVFIKQLLEVHGETLLRASLSISGNMDLMGSLSVQNNTCITGSLDVYNNTFIEGSLSVSAPVYVEHSLIIEGNILQVPNGLETGRPLPNVAPTGSVYYNNDTIRFEGLHDLGGGVKEWLPFGGVVDIDGDTFITAENEPNDNTLTFFTGSRVNPSAIFTSDTLSIHTNVVVDKKIELKQNATFSNDVLIIGTLSVGNLITDTLTNISEATDVLCEGILSVNQKSYLMKDVHMYQNVYVEKTLNTSNLGSSNLYVGGSIMKIPTGANTDRPLTHDTPTGSIYYNNDTIRFEGLHDLGGGVKEWLPFGGVIDIDGDTFISAEVTPNNNTLSFFTGDKITPVTTLTSSLLSVGTDVYMDNTLSVNNRIYTPVLYASNIETSNINILSELVFNGDYVVQGNLEVIGNLTINDTTFPLFPNTNDVSKVLAVNDTNDYQLMTLFHENRTCEFKSLFGVFETGTELEEISGLFDFGVPKYWLSGWSGRLFDGVDYTDGQGILVPDGSNVDMSTIELYENVSTSNMDFKDFINISMYKTNGDKLNKISGIAVDDFVNPNYYFFLGTVDPNHDFFKYKFKQDFETFYSDLPNKTYGSNYGYRVDVSSIRVPHRSLHSPGTNLFVVEFINTYDNCAVTYDYTYKFNRSVDEETRKTKYYLTSSDNGNIQLIEGTGLFPHITYRKWKNSSKPMFYEKKYHEDIGWGQTPNINDIYTRHHNNGNLKQLYKLTYNFIKSGLSAIDTGLSDASLDTLYETNVVNVSGHNLILNSNINQNDNYITGNYNTISFDKLAFN